MIVSHIIHALLFSCGKAREGKMAPFWQPIILLKVIRGVFHKSQTHEMGGFRSRKGFLRFLWRKCSHHRADILALKRLHSKSSSPVGGHLLSGGKGEEEEEEKGEGERDRERGKEKEKKGRRQRRRRHNKAV